LALRRINKSFAPSNRDIRYLSKTFPEFRQNLIDFAKVYFPDSYADFNEASPGMMFIEMAAYVGDVLGYYIDTNFRENLLPYAEERDNIVSIAQSLGYKTKPATAASCEVDIFQLCPATDISGNYEPDIKFYMRLSVNAVFSATEFSNITYRTVDEVNFADPTGREITIYATDSNNRPLTYLIKKKIKVVSGTLKTYIATFGDAEKFSKVTLPDDNILEIVSAIDNNGNRWSEVDYLAQDLVFEDVVNTNANTDPSFSVPPTYLIRIKRTPRRFVSRYDEDNKLELQFGSGVVQDGDETINLEPRKIANSEYQTNLVSTSLDPSDFLSSRSYGLAPSNIDIEVTYTTGGGLESNVPSNTITQIITAVPLNDISSLTSAELLLWNDVVRSLAVNNDVPATGGKGEDTIEEIRQNALAFFNAQNRLVTVNDYIVRTYAAPPKYGGAAKVFVTRDEQINDILRATQEQPSILTEGSFVQNKPGQGAINMYMLGYNQQKKLTNLNMDTKKNLRTYLDQYRMLTDEVRMLDAFPVNIGVEFKVSVYKNYNMNEVLARAIDVVANFFDIDKWQINQPIILNDLYLEIASVEGVQSVLIVKIFNRYKFRDGADYEDYLYDIEDATNSGIVYPSLDPCIFELRYPEKDIIGSAVQ
jgi:hypothetical protein